MSIGDIADGYYTKITYPLEFHRHTTPVWLNLATLLAGHRPKDLSKPFRWCDLGCGQGITAVGVAALYPQAEIYGFDFDPSHMENAARLAAEAGLSNAYFADASFEDLADAPQGRWPKMDFIILHGVWSWVSAAQRAHVLRFVARHLAPGGIVYNGYNAMAGWAALLPVQKMLRHLRGTLGPAGEDVLGRGLNLLRELEQHGAAFFADNPIIARRLEFLGRQDANYLCHELLHEHWTPFSPDEVAADFAQAQCGFIGSATLLENFDIFSVPQPMVPMLAATQDPVRKEIMRDFGSARMFRRDIFRRGTEKPLPGEWLAALDELTLADLGMPDDGTMRIKTWGEEGLALRPEIYGPVRQGLRAGPLRMGDLRELFPDVLMLKEMAAVLCATAVAHPLAFASPNAAQQQRSLAFNQAVSRHNAQGGRLHILAASRLGTALLVPEMEQIMTMAFSAAGAEAPVDQVAAHFAGTSLELLQAGKPVLEPEARLAGWRHMAANFAANRLPVLQRAGAAG